MTKEPTRPCGPPLKKMEIRMDTTALTIADFQKLISDKYEKVDRERGSAKTFLWFIEEVGELATALNGTDRANLHEEFADVLAWLCTLANINDVDLATAVRDKYISTSPDGHK
jgi:NTP pyrophosphatase (non-canonical NTP hydrolase)